jgi:hypothetical protein
MVGHRTYASNGSIATNSATVTADWKTQNATAPVTEMDPEGMGRDLVRVTCPSIL